MNESFAFDPDLYPAGSPAAQGSCSYHGAGGGSGRGDRCAGEAVVSFQDSDGSWQSGCASALETLVEAGQITPLGQGA
jgi:hypothetical protein